MTHQNDIAMDPGIREVRSSLGVSRAKEHPPRVWHRTGMASDGYATPIPTFEIEEGDGGGSTLTPNQRKAMSTRADMPSSTDSCAFDPKRLCITLTMLWAAGSISFVLSVLAVGVGAAGGEGGGTTTTTTRTTGSVCLARHHEGTQLFGEDVVEHDGHHYQVGCLTMPPHDGLTMTPPRHHRAIVALLTRPSPWPLQLSVRCTSRWSAATGPR